MTKKAIVTFTDEIFRLMPLIIKGVQKKQRDALGMGKITVPQFISLSLLRQKGLIKMKDIAKEPNVSLPAATGLIDRLVGLGMVKRMYDEKDRRAIYIALTDKGEKALDEIRATRGKVFEGIFDKLTEEERNAYLNVLRKMVGILYSKDHGK